MTTLIPLTNLDPHPDNPKSPRKEVIKAIASMLKDAPFNPRYAILARVSKETLAGTRYQIIGGHHRVAAAKLAGLEEIPANIIEASDDEALHLLGTDNMQEGMTPIEHGRVALTIDASSGRKGEGLAAYARAIGKNRSQVQRWRQAAEVQQVCGKSSLSVNTEARIYQQSLPGKPQEDVWKALVAAAPSLKGKTFEAWVSETLGPKSGQNDSSPSEENKSGQNDHSCKTRYTPNDPLPPPFQWDTTRGEVAVVEHLRPGGPLFKSGQNDHSPMNIEEYRSKYPLPPGCIWVETQDGWLLKSGQNDHSLLEETIEGSPIETKSGHFDHSEEPSLLLSHLNKPQPLPQKADLGALKRQIAALSGEQPVPESGQNDHSETPTKSTIDDPTGLLDDFFAQMDKQQKPSEDDLDTFLSTL